MSKPEMTVELMLDPRLNYGLVYVADNGLMVVTCPSSLTTHKNGRRVVQIHEKPISDKWMKRRVNAFAEEVAAMPLRKVRPTAPKKTVESKSVQKRKKAQSKKAAATKAA